jgi:DNA modification methylase
MKFNLDEYVRGDAFDYLSDISDNSVDLVFTSCPDLSQTDFDKSRDGINSYQDFQKRAVEHFSRVVKPKGFVVICQTDRRVNGSVLSNHMWYANCLEECDMVLKDYKIVVRNQVGKKDMYYFTFQHMLIYTYEGTIKRGGDWLRDIYVDKQEKIGNQSVWSQDFCKFVIDNLTKENDVVIDPFAGVGPVLIAARTLNRRWWGAEIADEFFNEDLQTTDTTKSFWP